jgi:hypothetical protein
MLMVVDPCYVLKNEVDESQYSELCERSLGQADRRQGTDVCGGTAFSTEVGDGRYDIYALRGEHNELIGIYIDIWGDHVEHISEPEEGDIGARKYWGQGILPAERP